jgi:hypothetical protein
MRNQRGEGKLGCLISLLLLGSIAAAAYKAVPVYYGNSELIDACDFIASGSARKPVEIVEKEVKDKARELGVTEALTDKHAIQVTKTGSGDSGFCNIHLRFQRTIDFYGTYRWTMTVDKRISKPVYENL